MKTRALAVAFGLLALAGCAGAQKHKTLAYAPLRNDRLYEYEFPTVWKAIEETLRNYKIVDRDPSEVDDQELRDLQKRTLETDWIYGQSRDKYAEYVVDKVPKKKPLQVRFKYEIEAKRAMGGTHVQVKMSEELEQLKPDGRPDGYASVDRPDTSRTNELLEKIQLTILKAAP